MSHAIKLNFTDDRIREYTNDFDQLSALALNTKFYNFHIKIFFMECTYWSNRRSEIWLFIYSFFTERWFIYLNCFWYFKLSEKNGKSHTIKSKNNFYNWSMIISWKEFKLVISKRNLSMKCIGHKLYKWGRIDLNFHFRFSADDIHFS